MLVLSRKVGQEIRIGDNVTIVVNKVSGNRVSIGIVAPMEVPVVRGEIPRIEQEDSEAVCDAAVGLEQVIKSAFDVNIEIDTFMATPSQPR